MIKGLIRFNVSLGYGRALEAYMITLQSMIGGLFLVDPTHAELVYAFADLTYYVPPRLFAFPFLIITVIQTVGLSANCRGKTWSWVPRFIGATLANTLWSWILIKSVLINSSGFGMPVSATSVLGLIWVAWMAWNQLPTPGVAQIDDIR